MEIDRQENGALIIRAYKGVPFYEAKWRDATRGANAGAGWAAPGWCRTRTEAGPSAEAESATAFSTRDALTER